MAQESSDTPARLVAAAREVFARDGLAGARMEDVATAAGVSRAALYYHFHTKHDLARALLEEWITQLGVTVRAALADGPCEALVGAVLRFFATHTDVARLLILDAGALADMRDATVLMQREVVQPVRDRLAADVAAGRIRPLDPRVGAAALFGMVNDNVLGRIVLDKPLDVDALEPELTEMARRAIAL